MFLNMGTNHGNGKRLATLIYQNMATLLLDWDDEWGRINLYLGHNEQAGTIKTRVGRV